MQWNILHWKSFETSLFLQRIKALLKHDADWGPRELNIPYKYRKELSSLGKIKKDESNTMMEPLNCCKDNHSSCSVSSDSGMPSKCDPPSYNDATVLPWSGNKVVLCGCTKLCECFFFNSALHCKVIALVFHRLIALNDICFDQCKVGFVADVERTYLGFLDFMYRVKRFLLTFFGINEMCLFSKL